MEKIHIRFMKDIRNIEFGELFDIISNVIVAEKIDIPLVNTAIERIKPHCKELLRMNNKKLRHPFTDLIQKQVNSRTEYLACLRMTVDAKMLSHKSEERSAATHLMLWLRSYKNDIYAPTIHRQSRMVKNLMDDRDLSPVIQQSTALLNLDELLEAIVESGAKINSNYLERLDEKESYNVNGVAIRNGAYMDFKVLVSVIEASYSISTDDEQREQLVQLSLSINENLKDFRTLLRSRTTKRRNKKDVEIAVKELINDLSVGESEEKVVKDLSVEVDDTLNELEEVELAGGEELPMTCVAPAKHKCTKPELRMSQLRGAGTPYSQQEILAP